MNQQIPLVLRPTTSDHLPTLFEQQRDPEANYQAAFTAKDPNDRAAYDAHWTRVLANPEIVMRTVFVDDVIVGSVLSFVQDGMREVSFWFGKEFWGKGFATAALRDYLTEMPNRPIYAHAATDNYGSLRVLEKCGFQIIETSRYFANARNAEIDEFLLVLNETTTSFPGTR